MQKILKRFSTRNITQTAPNSPLKKSNTATNTPLSSPPHFHPFRKLTHSVTYSSDFQDSDFEELDELEKYEKLPDDLLFNVIETTINRHGGRAKLKSNPSELYEKYNHVPLFNEMLLVALKYGCTLLLPQNIHPTVDFFLTHLVRRHPTSNKAVTLNGNYVKIYNEHIDVFFQPENSKTFPWKMCLGVFKNFPKSFDDNLPPDIDLNDEKKTLGIEDTVGIDGNGLVMTPYGDLPVLLISRPFNLEGCSWGVKFDELNTFEWCDLQLVQINMDAFDGDIDEWMYVDVYIDKSLKFAIELENQSELHEVKEYVEIVIEKIGEMVSGKSFEEMSKLFNKIVNGIMKKVNGICLGESQEEIRRAIEGVLVHHLFNEIWPPLIEENYKIHQDLCDKDKEIDWRIRALQFVQLKDFEIEFMSSEVGHKGIVVTIQQLRRLNSFKNPHQKAMIIISALKFLQFVIQKTCPGNGPVSADVFFPTLVYVIIKGNIPYFASNIGFIKAFMQNPIDELSYYLTSIESVFCFIKDLEGKNIGWDEQSFYEAINFSKIHYSPFDSASLNVLRPQRQINLPTFERIKESSEIVGRMKKQLLDAFIMVTHQNEELKKQLDK
ncbi:RAB GDP/GTP exchange factor, putative [Entamoeba invadens IP1]|uniref:RAB GDP/GTP exchange factor, putative n=1 Tax=Entamoeba invadens IP1 TaxID=370355 RepID=A0A0A1TX59_ENTIV|nr:RAB GDP/GTP exchange factor, putative [Entamoeba invadens IP1]ELP85890.1 RAB GDP/GTP exchange factor, putative [Entamoeba invadens IP1]|eukprot:XP_004185236.1 RAB GDP/GTP exchange factor, putative [Entamoeba invadens IP1]